MARPPLVEVQDATNEQIRDAMDLARMNPNLSFSDALASTVGKKRARRRPKSKRGNGKPTGFEEYFADGPLTPNEHAEMLEIFNPRIEEALRRFQFRRRIEPARLNMFSKYLKYGGVEIGANITSGANNQDLKNMTKDQLMQARAMAKIQKERATLDVDFDVVLRGFMSSYFIRCFKPETEEVIKMATETIKNFYTYLLQRDVCPEYTDNMLQARKTCDLAAKELWLNVQLMREGPGPFNESCSMLFGGAFFQSKAPFPGSELEKSRKEKMEHARDVVRSAIAGAGSFEQASRFQKLVNQKRISAKKVLDIDGFDILSVIQPEAGVLEFYEKFAPMYDAVGRVKAVSFRDPAKPDPDMSPEERREWNHGKAPKYKFEFLVDKALLPLMYPGLKVISGVWELNCGVYYLDEILSIYPTFYTVIANGMMMKWKWPRDLTFEDEKKANGESKNAVYWTTDVDAPKQTARKGSPSEGDG
ncbi:uncharacterized protein N7443_000430 [Penicillium atrosanguineum]|uniref:uncharacterized protein n=1 Tax=Penicillium atrosanguineum TaxID=1132637 RepID=UPI0023825E5B|nr:uncharacterized protein N7443_000430 [Penicillium atrosanguineum]KAJ5313546.1 hypothetical protein N7443_000430 [Penicillium atrosanguineum]